MKKRSGYNPKRKIAPADKFTEKERTSFARRCSYGGNPEHKRNPANYGLTPPSSPRPGKTLCDASGNISKADAKRLITAGFRKGMVSVRDINGWPSNVWSVSKEDEVYEACLENRVQGIYHGYPMPNDDDFRAKVIEEWKQR